MTTLRCFITCIVCYALHYGIKAQNIPGNHMKILKYNHPGLVVDAGVGLWVFPMPVDWDGDGDWDLIVSCPDRPTNGILYFENLTGNDKPLFAPPVKLADAVKDIQLSYIGGLPRYLVPGSEIINFSASYGKEYKVLFPADSIIKDFPGKPPRYNHWRMVDYDGDGDADIVVGVDDWSDYGWDNAFDKNGNWTNGPLHGYVYLIENQQGTYVKRGRIKAGGKDLDVFGAPSPNFADFDGDGDLDLICGEFRDKFTYFENTGSRQAPVYAKGRLLSNPAGVITMDLQMIFPMTVDWNKDGFMDLVVGDEDGRIALLLHTGKVVKGMPEFKSPVYFKQQADNVKFGALATPFGVDWDNDGDEDIISGNSAGYIGFIENLGMYNGMPRWAAPVMLKSEGKTIRIQSGTKGSIQGPAECKWGYTTLSVADWDGDGLKDIIVNTIWGKVIWYKNTGTRTAPRLGKEADVMVQWETAEVPKPAWVWWTPPPNSLVTQWRTTPFAIDWNKDNLTDLIMLDTGGYLTYFERFQKGNTLWLKPGKRIFYGVDFSGYAGSQVPRIKKPGILQLNTNRFGGSGRRKLSLGDWDGDGDLDMLINSHNASIMENVGTDKGLVLFKNHDKLGDLILAGHDTSPTTVDWNKDGVPDLLVGAEDGHYYYMINPRKGVAK